MHLIPLLLYGCAAGAYVAHFNGRDRSTGRLATGLLGMAVLAHTFLIGMQTVHAGHAPLVGTTAAVSAFVWLLGISYLYVELSTDERAMGVLVAGLLWPWLSKLGLGRLPGDIRVETGNSVFYFPLATCLLVSVVLSLVLWLLRR